MMCVKHIIPTINSNRSLPLLPTSSRGLEFVTVFVCDVDVVELAAEVTMLFDVASDIVDVNPLLEEETVAVLLENGSFEVSVVRPATPVLEGDGVDVVVESSFILK
jgi:hypothetical protein